MVLSFVPSDEAYIAYIDESGDPGIKRVSPLDPNGASEWFSIGAVVIKAERKNEIVDWVKHINSATGTRRKSLHFADLSPTQRNVVCRGIASHPLRCFAVVSNKKNMQGYRNIRAEQARSGSSNETFYNFCIRIILERITEFVHRRSVFLDHGRVRHLRLIFSERGGLRLEQTIAYHDILINQSRSGLTVLDKREIVWEVLHSRLVETLPHSSNAGLQLADTVASAFRFAADSDHPKFTLDNAKILKPRMWSKGGHHSYQGVTFLPWNPKLANLKPEQKEIFKFYGYRM